MFNSKASGKLFKFLFLFFSRKCNSKENVHFKVTLSILRTIVFPIYVKIECKFLVKDNFGKNIKRCIEHLCVKTFAQKYFSLKFAPYRNLQETPLQLAVLSESVRSAEIVLLFFGYQAAIRTCVVVWGFREIRRLVGEYYVL